MRQGSHGYTHPIRVSNQRSRLSFWREPIDGPTRITRATNHTRAVAMNIPMTPPISRWRADPMAMPQPRTNLMTGTCHSRAGNDHDRSTRRIIGPR